MFINEKKMAIEMTKKFASAARKFGTQEYRNLQEARRDYPNFKVVTITRKTSGKKDTFKGLTYDFMENYIKNHDNAEQSIMAEYQNLRGLSEEAKANLMEPYTYGDMKKWFLNKFPAIEKFRKQCDELVAA
jgi:hypothetical protein